MENLIERRIIRKKSDYIVMGYGLCSKATIGLETNNIPLVLLEQAIFANLRTVEIKGKTEKGHLQKQVSPCII